tara:strand:- start:338 stop:556 length:219 start_codon:yes stop_codon:yes gene_type:complete
MEFISFIKEILFFRWKHALAIIKSWIWIVIHPNYLYQRRQRLKKTHNIKNIYRKSIVVKYFLMGKKTFSKIV